MKKFSKKKIANYDQNDGVPGVVYILTNRGLAWNYLKIGCTRHSGEKRADDLNRDANTGTPGEFKCRFQKGAVDCGLAEKRVFERLKNYRANTQKTMQEFFCLDLGLAKTAVSEECEKVNRES
ncbi:MAG: GIY-YIG nuclease family protein [Alphaproteobacteria bacterium]|nr:GIY-YIG nuclease family protein [Alphaproteobacteria bacterium]